MTKSFFYKILAIHASDSQKNKRRNSTEFKSKLCGFSRSMLNFYVEAHLFIYWLIFNWLVISVSKYWNLNFFSYRQFRLANPIFKCKYFSPGKLYRGTFQIDRTIRFPLTIKSYFIYAFFKSKYNSIIFRITSTLFMYSAKATCFLSHADLLSLCMPLDVDIKLKQTTAIVVNKKKYRMHTRKIELF